MAADTFCDVSAWHCRDIVESTPYGHNMDKHGDYIVHSQPPEAAALRESHVMFKDYDFPTGDEGPS
jgi:hypothetical protein